MIKYINVTHDMEKWNLLQSEGLSQSITYGKTICLKLTKKSNSFFKKKHFTCNISKYLQEEKRV